VAYQAGYLLRLLELPPTERFDFAGTGTAPGQVEELLTTGQPQADDSRPHRVRRDDAAHWAMMNLRSYAIGMRIDQWLADEHPELRLLQPPGHGSLQQENLQLLSKRIGKLVDPGAPAGPGGGVRAVCRPAAGQDGLRDTVPGGRRAGPGRRAALHPRQAAGRVPRTTESWSMPGPRHRHDRLVHLDPLQALTRMATEFKIPLHRFDTNLLPPEARQVGTDAFKTAVVMHFAAEYAAQGQTAMVTVDDQEITVMAFPAEASALDFVMPMLKAGKIAEAVPYLESLTKSAPANAAVLYNLGIAYSELGQYDEAIIR
jgi:hypothetical protein